MELQFSEFTNRPYLFSQFQDLKEEKKKTLTEIKDDDSKDISESSRMHWEKYVNGNTSIISDLFQGQSVSEIRCQDCTKVTRVRELYF